MSKKAKDITVGETVFNRGQSFIVKEVRVDAEHGWIAFLDTEGSFHDGTKNYIDDHARPSLDAPFPTVAMGASSTT